MFSGCHAVNLNPAGLSTDEDPLSSMSYDRKMILSLRASSDFLE